MAGIQEARPGAGPKMFNAPDPLRRSKSVRPGRDGKAGIHLQKRWTLASCLISRANRPSAPYRWIAPTRPRDLAPGPSWILAERLPGRDSGFTVLVHQDADQRVVGAFVFVGRGKRTHL